MRITSIIPRKDGKFLVGLHFNQGTNLRKVMTPEELKTIQTRVEEDRKQAEAYHSAQLTSATGGSQ